MSFADPEPARVRTVLLDLDGVLMDHTRAAQEAIQGWLGPRLTQEVRTAWFVAQDRRLAEWRDGTATWEEQRRNRLKDVLPLLGEPIGTDDELDALFASGYGAAYRRAWHGFDDAAPAIRALHEAGFATAVLTNGAEDQQSLPDTAVTPLRGAPEPAGRGPAKLRAVGLLDVIGPVFTAGALGLRKPDPRAFLAACERLEVAPPTVLYVGDEHDVDVVGARGAGLQAVLLQREGDPPAGETAVVRSLAELPALLAR